MKPKKAEIIFSDYGVTGRRIAANDLEETIHLILEARKEIKPHILPFKIFFYVAKGIGILVTENCELEMKSGDYYEIDKGCIRGWRNLGEEELHIIGIKSFRE